jgi:hypothetical protein
MAMNPDIRATVQAALLAALERRAANLDGPARQQLDARIAMLQGDAAAAARALPAAAGPGSSLHALLDQWPRRATPPRDADEVLAELRGLWSQLRGDDQLRQAEEPAPDDAGPLNSTALASRAIALMRECSPACLRAFLGYVDQLAWLEQLGNTGTSGAAAPRRRSRRKPGA